MPTVSAAGPSRADERRADPRIDETDDLRATVSLTRRHPSDCGDRQVFARIDGGPRIALVFDQSVTVEVPPGRHVLSAHNTLFRKRVPFVIEPAEHLEFELINSARWWTPGMAGLLGAAPLFLTVRQIRTPDRMQDDLEDGAPGL
jgi:hypothetical protein